MKKLYTLSLLTVFTLLLYGSAKGQCPNGQPNGGTAYDTTISFPSGVMSTQVKFPKFNPQSAMLSCVKLIVTIVGVADSVKLQNLSSSACTGRFRYLRTDEMSGPGLTPSLEHSANITYGPYNLAPYDGTAGSGPDFHSIVNDTVLKETMTRELTDSVTISQFYGTDSLVYNYAIDVDSYASFAGCGSSSNSVATSAFVNFRLEYCTCPLATLPLGLQNFSAIKTGNGTAALRWEAKGDNNNYLYEVEYSRDGTKFMKAGTVAKQHNTHNPQYNFGFTVQGNNYGRYYFRVKQRWANGWYQYTHVEAVEFVNPMFATVSLYPNPSSGVVGLKFVNAKPGRFTAQVSNAQGQLVLTKEVTVAATDYKVIATLQKGFYYVKLTDPATGAFCINEMLIQ